MRILELPSEGTPKSWGELHGSTFRREIREIASIRLDLTHRLGGFASKEEVLHLAKQHMLVLKEFDWCLHQELEGIARGADLDPAWIVILNHYTDLRDIGPNNARLVRQLAGKAGSVGGPVTAPVRAEGVIPIGPPQEDCTALLLRTYEGNFLAQTWDMHGSAEPYVMALKVPARSTKEGHEPAMWLLSITGCLGMTGLNSSGVGLTINNLRSTDARIGVVWPALVRKSLRARTARSAASVIRDARMGSGHHYLVADRSIAYAFETSGTETKKIFSGPQPKYVHTNHCLDKGVRKKSILVPGSTSLERFGLMTAGATLKVQTMQDVWALLGSHENHPRSVCTHLASEDSPNAMATCAGINMNLNRKELWMAQGCLHGTEPQRFGFQD